MSCGVFAAQSPMVFTHLSTADGLSQATVNDILQDSEGFLWLATENGLNRYDGIRIKRYYRERNNPEGLVADYIRAIDEDANGDLWLATEGSGLVKWNRRSDTFVSFRHRADDPDSLASDMVRGVLVDSRGQIWAATRDAGLDRLDPATGKVTHFVHYKDDSNSLSGNLNLYTVLEDAQGNIWVGTDAGLDRYNVETGRFDHYSPPNSAPGEHIILTLLEDHLGKIWVGTFDSGLLRLDPEDGRFDLYVHTPDNPGSLNHNQIGDVFEDAERRLWVGTSGGLNLLNRETGTFQHFVHDRANPTSLAENAIRSIMQDRSGLLWVGTGSNGVSRWNPRSWSLGHREPMWLPEVSMINAFADAPGGAIWFGTSIGLLRLETSGAITDRLGMDMLGDDTVMTLLTDRQGQLWIGTMSGGITLYRPDGTLERFTAQTHDALGANGIMSFFEDSQGRIWIGTFEGGLSVYDPNERSLFRYRDQTGEYPMLGRIRCSAITQDGQGRIWVATSGDGLFIIDPESRGVLHQFLHDPYQVGSIAVNAIYALFAEPQGGVWVGTSGGGLDYAADISGDVSQIRFENLSQPDGLSNDVIYGIEADGNGDLWLPSNNGLMRLNPQTRTIRTYYPNHGAQSEEFSFGAHFQSRSGYLYFAGNGGYNAFDPLQIQETMVQPPVLITDIAVQNQPVESSVAVSMLDALTLQHSDTSLVFEFAALDFTDPQRNQFAYKLEGFDEDWIALRNEHRVSYTNLDQGRYVFRVKAASADSVWNTQGVRLAVTVLPAPWRTWWAYLLYAILLLMLVAAVYLRQTRRMREQEEYAQRLAAEVKSQTAELNERNQQLAEASAAKSSFLARMSHEIRTPMNGVMGMTELLSSTPLTTQQNQYTQTISRSAQTLLQIINDILDLSKIEAGRVELESRPFDFEYVIDDCIALLAAQAQDKCLDLVADVDPQTPRILIGDEVRVRQVIINLLGNALKFTAEGEVTLRTSIGVGSNDHSHSAATQSVKTIRVEVIDTGVGIAEEGLAGVFDAFSQVDESTTRRFGGTGLGLSICKQLVELMGGKIGASSQENLGSTFWFELPLRAQSETPIAQAVSPLAGLRVLLALPSGSMIQAIARRLRAEGAIVQTVENIATRLNEDARDLAEGQPYDVFIADEQQLPELEQLVDQLQPDGNLQRPAGRSLGIVLTSLPAAMGEGASSSELPHGITTVRLTKPLAMSELSGAIASWASSANEAHNEEPQVETPAAQSASADGARVLVVEDNAVNQLVAEGMLEQLGFQTLTASDGREAIAALATGSFDLVLMDCQMPVMDGFEATRQLRASEGEGSHLPVIGLTAHASEHARQECLAAGMDDFLSKPYTADGLSAVLRRWIPTA